MKKYLRYIILAFVLITFIAYFVNNGESLNRLKQVNAGYLLAIALLNVLAISANGLFIRSVMKPFKKRISIKESFYVSLISSVGNFFGPAGGGFGIRAVYLRKKFGLAYSEYTSTLIGNYVLVFIISSIFGIISLLYLNQRQSRAYWIILVFLGGLLLFSIFLTRIRIRKLPENDEKGTAYAKLVRALQLVGIGWTKIMQDKRLLIELSIIILINFAFMVCINFFIMQALQTNLSVAALVLFSVLGSLSLFINITPANIGVKELVYVFASSVLLLSVHDIVMIAIIERGVMFFVLAACWIYFSFRGSFKKIASEET